MLSLFRNGETVIYNRPVETMVSEPFSFMIYKELQTPLVKRLTSLGLAVVPTNFVMNCKIDTDQERGRLCKVVYDDNIIMEF